MALFKKQLIWVSLAVLLAGVPLSAAEADWNGGDSSPEKSNRVQVTGAAFLQRDRDNGGRGERHEQFRGNRGGRNERGEREERGRQGYYGRNYYGVPYRSSPFFFGFSYNSPYYYNYTYPYYGPYYGYNGYSSSYEIGYNDGLNAGRLDRERGIGYNPRRYTLTGDIDYLNGFNAGYAAGYSAY